MMKLRPLLTEVILSSKIYYHGTNKSFDKFEFTDDLGSKGSMLGKGIYLTDDIEYAKSFGSNIIKCNITAKNPLDLTKAREGLFDDFLPYITKDKDKEDLEYCLRSRSLVTGYRIIREYVDMNLMKKLGYDCVLSWADNPTGSGTEVAVFDPKNIKIVK